MSDQTLNYFKYLDIVEANDDPDCIEKPTPALGLLNMVNRCLVERLSFANVESPKVKEFQNQAELGRFFDRCLQIARHARSNILIDRERHLVSID